jgi:flagella basal body P-ring formation protein FlgA
MRPSPSKNRSSLRQIAKPLRDGLLIAGVGIWMMLWAEKVNAAVIITPQALQKHVTEYVLKNTPLAEQAGTLSVECLHVPGMQTLKGTEVKWLIKDTRNTVFSPRFLVQVVLSTEAETRQFGLPVKLLLEKPVWVTTDFVRAKETMTLGKVMQQSKILSDDALYAVATSKDPALYTTLVNLAPGTILDERNLIHTPLVNQNQEVYVILSMNSGVQIKVSGRALQNGGIGDQVRVQRRMPNAETKTYIGEVVSNKTVLVKL